MVAALPASTGCITDRVRCPYCIAGGGVLTESDSAARRSEGSRISPTYATVISPRSIDISVSARGSSSFGLDS
jgi:hypothetical protein